MKKIILLLIVGFTTLMGIEFTMTESGLYPNVETQPTPSTPVADGWVETPLPSSYFNVLDYGLKGDGSTDDTAALEAIFNDHPEVTNLYFPAGYTFRLHKVQIHSRIEALFGGGTIKFHDEGNSNSGTSLWGFGFHTVPDNLIIDGLHFKLESGYTTAQNYGMITFWDNGGIADGIEIRNCTSDGSNGALNFLKVFPRVADGRSFPNMKVYNNTSSNCRGYFDFEYINVGQGREDGMPNFKMFNNRILNGSGHGAISYIRMTSYGAEIYNNYIDESGMAIEILSENVKVHHNKLLNIRGQALSLGTWTSQYGNVTGTETEIYNNHIEVKSTGYVFSYTGHNADIHDNYINGVAIFRLDVAGSQLILPNFYNNTVVNTIGSPAVSISNNIGGGNVVGGACYNNTVYTKSGSTGISVYSVDSSTNTSDNSIFIMNGTGTCINTVGTNVNNTCTQNYTGSVPTAKSGAGLSDPNNIGA
ncbi:glycosyl hydrolase family 28-related protein [Sulfurovum sp. XTW-4]|uniref:Glycosyl hydrolase family 28-related protein n=1 Tax=Sulfurovum xiamenensis TaxID=3019066 RepID=A0ABT7QTJ3_9BACT|nr:glycosyl hydrolase family 28-related protein [Sulfurovum xiamenensis]MDM5264384.1 glycosyl hydrolase family 28-related protein [Sulfurovum xiamenensis]